MTRPAASARLRRALALLPYIAAHGDVSIAELAKVFDVSEDVIRDDLEVLPFCGLPPYTADRLIGLVIAGDVVSLKFAEYFSRPLRLTPAEGFALLAAGRALLAVPGSEREGPLATGLAKLEGALGAQEVLDIRLTVPDHLETLRAAAGASERVELDYYSFGRDVVTARVVDPFSVVSMRGHWYLTGYCHEAKDERLFRVDRIRGVKPTGETFVRELAAETPADVFHASPDDIRVTLDLPASASWVTESFPIESLEEKRRRLLVTLAVSARPLIERILLTVGPKAKVSAPKDWRSVGSDAARRILANYRHQP